MILYGKNKISNDYIRIPKNKRKKDLFYYELRDSDGSNYNIERNILINNIGSLITNKDILENKEYITDKDFYRLNLEETNEFYKY